jgi:hypothetical protein
VKVGDKVISESEDGVRSVSTVTALDQPIRNHMCRLNFADGNVVNLTDEHPLMTKEGWKALVPEHTLNVNPKLFVEKMEIGDNVKREDGTWSELTNIACRSGEFPAYNLILGIGAHTYFADGFLAHNRGDECDIGTHWSCVGEGGDRSCQCCANGTDYTYGTSSAWYGFLWDEDGNYSGGCPSGTTRTGAQRNYWCDSPPRCREGRVGGEMECLLNSCVASCDANLWGEWTPASYCGTVTQNRINDCGSTENRTSTCTECGPHISAWSSCNGTTHKRTRTCTTDCGNTALCDGVAVEEDCLGEIRGTIFDASEMEFCPGFDATTGYITSLDPSLLLSNRTFGMSDVNTVAPHPFPILTSPVQTNTSGNYLVSTYAPGEYQYDWSALKDIYVIADGPKLACVSNTALVPGNPIGCTTQPCSVVKNISFGFLRYIGGWWQAKGAGVHGEGGVKSSVPSTLPTEQSLIVPDSNNKSGVLSYAEETDNMLGLNSAAQVSTKGWEAESSYQGLIYNWAYFNQLFKKHFVTEWEATVPFDYNDQGRGYQIFKVTGDITDFNYSPAAGQKVVIIVEGDVKVTSDIVVPNGAFLSVIVKDTLTFDQAVGRADGWYISDHMTIPCNDLDDDDYCDKTDVQFHGQGSFVAWRTTQLSRDMGDPNQTSPSELFEYRADLYTNAPEVLKNISKVYSPFVP